MAVAKKKAAPKVDAAKNVKTVAKVLTVNVKAPQPAIRGRIAQKFKYTGKELSGTKVKTPQFVALVISIQDIEDKSFNRDSFVMQQVVDLGVEEGHISMPNTKNPEKQKKRIVACYKKTLVDEGFIEEVK
tara:strand:- start:25 stop:414 length:390 start_codon:yes stop_codon:yes gene_type:complete